MLRKLWKWLAATFSLIVIMLAIGIGLFRLLLPMVPQYHERIEAFASEAAGTPVRIERIDARWGLKGPELRFHNAQLLTTDSNESLLSAETGSVVIDIGALLRHQQLRAGRVILDGLRIEVMRNGEGQWRVGGRTLTSGGGTLPRRLAVGLRGAQIVFRDDVNQAGPWVFDEVDLDIRLQSQGLSVDGITQLPGELGGEIEISIEADGDMASPDTVMSQVYLRGAGLDLAGWTDLMPQEKTTPGSGSGDVTAWFLLEGTHLQQASLQLDLRQVLLARNAEPVRLLEMLKGHFEFDRIEAGWQASGRDIIVTSGGSAWPAAGFEIEQVGANEDSGLVYADLDYVRLDDVLPLADWIPDEKFRARLARLRPRGVLEDFSFRLTHRQGQVDSYTLRSDFTGLGMNAADTIPGFDNVRGNVRLDAFGGRLQLDPASVVIDMPGLLARPVLSQRMNGVVVWRKNASGWRFVSDNIDLDHAAFRSSSNLELTLPADKSSPILDLRVDLNAVDVAGLRSVVPEPILKPKLRAWLNDALVGGSIPTAKIEWSGAVGNFPFDDNSGEFRVDAELQDVELAYARKWPVARAISGTLSFRNAGFMAGLSGADLSGNRVSSASVSMEDLRKGILKIQATADGRLNKLHGFLKETPVVKGENDPLARVDFAGFGTTEVDLTLPIKRLRDGDVSVVVSTESGEVALRGLQHRLEQVEGTLAYRNGEFFGNAITASVLGAPVVIDVAPDTINTDEGPKRATVATGRGRITDQDLATLHELLPSMLRGSTDYTATVSFPEKSAAMPVTVEIASRLDGMAVTLPEPVTKSAGAAKNFLLTVALPGGGLQSDVVYGDIVNARVNWIRDAAGLWVLERGGIRLGAAPASLPAASGLAISGTAQRLDIGGWLNTGGAGKSGQKATISSVRLEVERLDAFGQELKNAGLSVDRSEREWLVQIDSPRVAGALFIPFVLDEQPIIANLERLHIGGAAGPGDGDEGKDDSEPDPRKVPHLDVQADDFRLGKMRLGQLRAQLRSTTDGIAVEQFTTQAATFSTQGRAGWRINEDRHNTSLDFKLLSSDVGRTLLDLDFDRSIEAGDAEIDFAVSWSGPPGPDFKKELDGTVKVRVGTGQLQAVEPGAGRVFGLFSFTALPRRLSLDFRDVFDTGFGFDYIQGDFVLDDGDAFTSNLVLEGPAAQVGIAGRAGLVARDYDQSAVVYGNFGATLPVAGVIAAGPVGGAAMLIFSEIFKKPLQDMARVNYQISGSWDEPVIERVMPSAAAEGES